MKKYRVEINHSYRHGQYGTDKPNIVTLAVSASSKKEAREKALNSLIGKAAGEFEHFPIDYEHAPEAYKNEYGWWCMRGKDIETHIINEYDVAKKNVFSIQIVEL